VCGTGGCGFNSRRSPHFSLKNISLCAKSHVIYSAILYFSCRMAHIVIVARTAEGHNPFFAFGSFAGNIIF
ncbi:hypothetical protein, partial [Zymomonas mobilis]|uniref:hypothetical protein n=1 Tax=Zymomonas mobilis TaxID=542 RepID=UPI0039E82596